MSKKFSSREVSPKRPASHEKRTARRAIPTVRMASGALRRKIYGSAAEVSRNRNLAWNLPRYGRGNSQARDSTPDTAHSRKSFLQCGHL